MREYIILIAGAAVLSALSEIMSPEGWKKYIGVITGLVIVSVAAAPIAKLKHIDLRDFENVSAAEDTVKLQDYSTSRVSEELEERVKEDIKDRIMREYGRECDVKVRLDINEDNKIAGVKGVELHMSRPPEELKEKIGEMYGIASDEVVLYG